MARKQRICKPGLTYLTSSRCIQNMNLMELSVIKDILLNKIVCAMKKYAFEFIDYSIVANQFKFIIKTLDENATISRIMQIIKAQFAREYNKIMNRIGPFWNERFTDTIIEYAEEPGPELLNLMWDISYDAVRNGDVFDPRDHPYNGIMAYIDQNYKPPVKITLHSYFLNLGQTFEERRTRFLEYEKRYLHQRHPGIP